MLCTFKLYTKNVVAIIKMHFIILIAYNSTTKKYLIFLTNKQCI